MSYYCITKQTGCGIELRSFRVLGAFGRACVRGRETRALRGALVFGCNGVTYPTAFMLGSYVVARSVVGADERFGRAVGGVEEDDVLWITARSIDRKEHEWLLEDVR